LQQTYPVWPRNGAFPELIILKQTLGKSDLKEREIVLAFYTA
jgi:hypothetical protein